MGTWAAPSRLTTQILWLSPARTPVECTRTYLILLPHLTLRRGWRIRLVGAH